MTRPPRSLRSLPPRGQARRSGRPFATGMARPPRSLRSLPPRGQARRSGRPFATGMARPPRSLRSLPPRGQARRSGRPFATGMARPPRSLRSLPPRGQARRSGRPFATGMAADPHARCARCPRRGQCSRSGRPFGTDMRGRLNLFQAAMLRWRELYPYNAVHVAEFAGPLDRARLSDAIGAHLTTMGVGGLTLDAPARRYDYAGGAVQPSLAVLPAGDDAARVVEDEMQRQLNLPFPRDGAYDPFRFFAVDAGATFHLGVAYDHFIAGGDSIVALLKGIACRYLGTHAGRGRDARSLSARVQRALSPQRAQVLPRPVPAAGHAAARAPRVPPALSVRGRLPQRVHVVRASGRRCTRRWCARRGHGASPATTC